MLIVALGIIKGYMTISNTPKLRKILARDGQVGPGGPENKKLERWHLGYF